MHTVTMYAVRDGDKVLAGQATVMDDPWWYGQRIIETWCKATGTTTATPYIMEVLWEGASKIVEYYETHHPVVCICETCKSCDDHAEDDYVFDPEDDYVYDDEE